ncbi:MAG: YibE/F family protein, partial [Anaerotignum sp.]
MEKEKLRYYLPVIVSAVFLMILFLMPTGYEGAVIYQGMDRCAARVLEVDDSMIIDTGLVRSGEQSCTLELLDGKFKGEIVNGCNMLNGSLEQDKIFAVGDKAQVVVSYQGDEIGTVTMIDHYRINVELLLAGLFAVFLLFFAGQTGLRAILSFGVTVLCIWKILVPLYLKGVNPVGVGMIVTLLLTGIIISLVYGFDRRTASAVL